MSLELEQLLLTPFFTRKLVQISSTLWYYNFVPLNSANYKKTNFMLKLYARIIFLQKNLPILINILFHAVIKIKATTWFGGFFSSFSDYSWLQAYNYAIKN